MCLPMGDAGGACRPGTSAWGPAGNRRGRKGFLGSTLASALTLWIAPILLAGAMLSRPELCVLLHPFLPDRAARAAASRHSLQCDGCSRTVAPPGRRPAGRPAWHGLAGGAPDRTALP